MKRVIFVIIFGLLLSGNAYAECIEGNCINGQGTYTYKEGYKYVGEYKDGQKDGKGTLTYPDGSKIDGEWKNSKPNGQGTFTYADGSKYVGELKYFSKHTVSTVHL